MRKIAERESHIERAIGDWLHYKGFCFFKQNTRGYFKTRVVRGVDGRKRVFGHFQKDLNPYARIGLPDYVVIYRGFYKGLEVKTQKGKLSLEQIEFHQYVRLKGQAPTSVVRSVEDTEKVMHDFQKAIDHFYERASTS